MAFVFAVGRGIVDIAYLTKLAEYMDGFDYLILYVVMLLMSYLISGKFARSLFKKSAMGTYREEER